MVVFDSLVQGHRAAVPREAEFVQGDLADLASVRAAFSSHRPEAVMHFAGHVRSGESMREPFSYLDENVRGGLNLMRAAVESERNTISSPGVVQVTGRGFTVEGVGYTVDVTKKLLTLNGEVRTTVDRREG